ncbi:Potassium transport protein high-affinity [Penicillium odoratum]|uniref:Potassium transport protein high-affinity n=1 Tax=Penicillium odoratum TaxID=1167516 RepID=UPI002547A929|nr:Potassium transport protein high-affinity [Penicillium odoratum]KAJ5745754.1 Potassium transport protein high-affinity [Penicillium odoratum]
MGTKQLDLPDTSSHAKTLDFTIFLPEIGTDSAYTFLVSIFSVQSALWAGFYKPDSMLTWRLFYIYLIDAILIIVQDLNNPAVNNLVPCPRVLAAIFQAVLARQTRLRNIKKRPHWVSTVLMVKWMKVMAVHLPRLTFASVLPRLSSTYSMTDLAVMNLKVTSTGFFCLLGVVRSDLSIWQYWSQSWIFHCFYISVWWINCFQQAHVCIVMILGRHRVNLVYPTSWTVPLFSREKVWKLTRMETKTKSKSILNQENP